MQFVRFCLLVVLAGIAYYFIKTDAPTPAKPWLAYATSIQRGRLEWFFNEYSTRAECEFYREQTVRLQSDWYRAPSDCFYVGYQNPLVLKLVNMVIDGNSFGCVVRKRAREKFEDPIYFVVLRGFKPDGTQNWDCVD